MDSADRIAELEDENRVLRTRVEKLAKYEPVLTSIEEDGGGVTITFEQAMVIKAFFAEAFVTILRELHAENYVETGFEHPDGTKLTVRVQRYLRKTPHELRLEAEAARDAALARSKELLEGLRKATERIWILAGRMRACDEHVREQRRGGDGHQLSLDEAAAWIEEQRALAAAGKPT